MKKDYFKEIEAIKNVAKADTIILAVIIKSVLATFNAMKFHGEMPLIVVDNYQDAHWGSSYNNEEKKILINAETSKRKNPFSCGQATISYCVSWAAAMHVLYEKGKPESSGEKEIIAEKVASIIRGCN